MRPSFSTLSTCFFSFFSLILFSRWLVRPSLGKKVQEAKILTFISQKYEYIMDGPVLASSGE